MIFFREKKAHENEEAEKKTITRFIQFNSQHVGVHVKTLASAGSLLEVLYLDGCIMLYVGGA